MENLALINYHETRDFSRKMSVTFEFLRQNFKGLGKSILLIAGPPVLLGSILMGSFFESFMANPLSASRTGNGEAALNMFMSSSFWLQVLLMVVFLIVSSVASLATINNYILLYEEKKSTDIEFSEVWTRVRETFMMYLGTSILFTVIAVGVYIVMIIPVVLLAAISPVLVFFGVMGLIVGVLYLFISCSLVFIVRAYERVGFMEALSRSFKLIQGKWWSTFGLMMVLYIVAGTVSSIFMVPWYLTTIVSSLHSAGVEGFESTWSGVGIVSTILLTVYYLVRMILYSLPAVGLAFQYFNLVERKEARGLMNQIDSFGQPPQSPPVNTEEHY